MPGSLPPTPFPISREASLNEAAPTPSPLFPRDLKALFALRPEEAETLVKEYGLGEHAAPASPIAAIAPAAESDARERNLNKFMAHIGVSRAYIVYLSVPRLIRAYIALHSFRSSGTKYTPSPTPPRHPWGQARGDRDCGRHLLLGLHRCNSSCMSILFVASSCHEDLLSSLCVH
jgi:hypothetical protein